jgi:hypothetical protein
MAETYGGSDGELATVLATLRVNDPKPWYMTKAKYEAKLSVTAYRLRRIFEITEIEILESKNRRYVEKFKDLSTHVGILQDQIDGQRNYKDVLRIVKGSIEQYQDKGNMDADTFINNLEIYLEKNFHE